MKYINYWKEEQKLTLPRYNAQFEKQMQIELERNGFYNPNLISKIVVTPNEKLINKTRQKLTSTETSNTIENIPEKEKTMVIPTQTTEL